MQDNKRFFLSSFLNTRMVTKITNLHSNCVQQEPSKLYCHLYLNSWTAPKSFSSRPSSCSWVFIHEKAYQTTDTGIESSVMTKVKGVGYHQGRVMDVADYVFPSQVGYPQ